jgi:adenylylsulfate kinase-like enzyme
MADEDVQALVVVDDSSADDVSRAVLSSLDQKDDCVSDEAISTSQQMIDGRNKKRKISNESSIYIIRGPPGSGKSTIASELCSELRKNNKFVAHIEQDYFRGGVLGDYGAKPEQYGPTLIGAVIGTIKAGNDVVVEGMFTYPKAQGMIEELVAMENSKLIFLEVDLNDVLERHLQREKSKTIPKEDIVKWYQNCGPTGLPNETIINNIDKNETIKKIFSI